MECAMWAYRLGWFRSRAARTHTPPSSLASCQHSFSQPRPARHKDHVLQSPTAMSAGAGAPHPAKNVKSVFPAYCWQWIMSRLQVVASRAPMMRDLWNHTSVAKRFSWVCKLLDEDASRAALRGEGMTRISKSWYVPRILSREDLTKCAAQIVAKWQGAMGVRSSGNVFALQAWFLQQPEVTAYLRKSSTLESASEGYVGVMRRLPGQVVLPDDKLKKFAWKMDELTYHIMLVCFVIIAAG